MTRKRRPVALPDQGQADDGASVVRRPLVYFIVGEPSGDQIGAHLMRALTDRAGGDIGFAGIGGPAMERAGLDTLFPIDLFAVMGLDFLPGLREILKRMKQLEADIAAMRPDCVVMIDAQTLSSRMGKRLRRLPVPLVQYVAPTVWAWRAGRAAKVAGYLDHLLTIFPFEEPYFAAHGLPVTFVGHPAAEPDAPSPAAVDAFRKAHVRGSPVLSLLPGSRRKELRRQIPLFRDVIGRLKESGIDPFCIMPVVSSVASLAESLSGDWPADLVRLPAESSKYLAFAAADAAIAASGTVTVELAFAGTPTVVTYRLPWHESRIGRMVLRTPFVSAVNIAAGEEIMPECVLEKCRPALIVERLASILSDDSLRAKQSERLRAVADQLRVPGRKPSAIAAEAILEVAGSGRAGSKSDNREKKG